MTTGAIHKIDAQFSGPGCAARLAGTSATAPGTENFRFTNSTGILTITKSGNLHFWDVSGCLGLISSGDAASFAVSFPTGQTITSP